MSLLLLLSQVTTLDLYQILASATWNNADVWSLASGGGGGAGIPGPANASFLDANSGNQTLDADLGTVANTAGDYSASTVGVLSIETTGYADIFDVNNFDLVIGSGGLTLAAGTMLGGTGTIVVRGDINGTGGTWNDETSTLVVDGGTVGTPLAITSFSPYKFVLSEGSYLEPVGALSIASAFNVYGSLVMAVNQTMTMASNAGLIVHANGSLATSGTGLINGFIGDVTIADGTSVTGILEMRNRTLTVTSDPLAATLRVRNTTVGTLTIASGTKITDVLLSYQTAVARVVAFEGGNEVHGNVTESGSTGTISATGIVPLVGAENQSWIVPQLDVSALTVAASKTAGTVTLSSSIAVDATGFYALHLTINQTLTLSGAGFVWLEGLLTIESGTTTCNVDVYCCGYVVDLGATLQGTGTIYYGSCGETINGTSTIEAMSAGSGFAGDFLL